MKMPAVGNTCDSALGEMRLVSSAFSVLILCTGQTDARSTLPARQNSMTSLQSRLMVRLRSTLIPHVPLQPKHFRLSHTAKITQTYAEWLTTSQCCTAPSPDLQRTVRERFQAPTMVLR
jgi:hypothetical protein